MSPEGKGNKERSSPITGALQVLEARLQKLKETDPILYDVLKADVFIAALALLLATTGGPISSVVFLVTFGVSVTAGAIALRLR